MGIVCTRSRWWHRVTRTLARVAVSLSVVASTLMTLAAPVAAADTPSATASSPEVTPRGAEGPSSTGLPVDDQPIGLPLALMAGVGIFLVVTGAASSRSSKLTDAPLRSSGSLTFPGVDP